MMNKKALLLEMVLRLEMKAEKKDGKVLPEGSSISRFL
jgi:hypothetical protein